MTDNQTFALQIRIIDSFSSHGLLTARRVNLGNETTVLVEESMLASLHWS